MLRLIIVHDRDQVVSRIQELISKMNVNIEHIVVCEDTTHAEAILSAENFDLMIMDLTVPRRKGFDTPSIANAEEFLQQVYDYGDLNAPGDVIGISCELEALTSLRDDLGPHFMVMIEEKDDDIWLNQLADRIKYTVKSARSRFTAMSSTNYKDVLIITAIDEEFAPYHDLFELHSSEQFPGVFEFIFNDKAGTARSGVAFSIGNSGQASAASRTQSLVSWYRPKLALMSGFCGGIKGKVEIGDLCCFRSVTAWDYGKWSEGENESSDRRLDNFLPRSRPISVTDTELDLIWRGLVLDGLAFDDADWRRMTDTWPSPLAETQLRVKSGSAASGSAVVGSRRIASQISQRDGSILVVDMESYGFYEACQNTFVKKPKFLCIKSVADFCDAEKDDQFHAGASFYSSVAVKKIITEKFQF